MTCNLVRGKTNPYPRQTLSGLLAEHTDLSPIQREAAAKFIGDDCLGLNPFSRLTVDQLELHQWLETAFMGGADEGPHPKASNVFI